MASGLAKGIEHISRGLERRDNRLRQEKLDNIAMEDRQSHLDRLDREESRLVEDRNIAADDRVRRIEREDEDRAGKKKEDVLRRKALESENKIREAQAEQAQRDLITDEQQREQEALAAISDTTDPGTIKGIINTLNEQVGSKIDPDSIEFLPDGSIGYNELPEVDESGQSQTTEQQIIPANLLNFARHRISRRELGDAIKVGKDDYRIYNPKTGSYERAQGITDKSEERALAQIEKKIDKVEDDLNEQFDFNPGKRLWADLLMNYVEEALAVNPPRKGVPSIRSLNHRTIRLIVADVLNSTEDLDVVEKEMRDQDFTDEEIIQEKTNIQEDILSLLDLRLRDAAGLSVSTRTRRLMGTPKKGKRERRKEQDSTSSVSEIIQGIGAAASEGLQRTQEADSQVQTGVSGNRRFK